MEGQKWLLNNLYLSLSKPRQPNLWSGKFPFECKQLPPFHDASLSFFVCLFTFTTRVKKLDTGGSPFCHDQLKPSLASFISLSSSSPFALQHHPCGSQRYYNTNAPCYYVMLYSRIRVRIYNSSIPSLFDSMIMACGKSRVRPEVNWEYSSASIQTPLVSAGRGGGWGGVRIHTHPRRERLSTWELLKCIHAHNVEEAQGRSNGCQGLARLSELRTTFSVSLAAGMLRLYNPAGSHSWECHMWALIKCYI